MYKRRINTLIALLLILVIVVNLAGCAVSGQVTGWTDAATESTAEEHKELGDATATVTGKAVSPFIYMIIDNATNLPLFIGTVMDISQ